MVYKRKNIGTCSSTTTVEIEEGVIKRVEFEGGCNGNLKGIGLLCVGQKPEDVIEKLRGTTCGFKSTSCPDQLAITLEEAIKSQAK